MIHYFHVRDRSGETGVATLAPEALRRMYPRMKAWRVYAVESAAELKPADTERLAKLLGNPVTQSVEVDPAWSETTQSVTYRRGITDNESPSVRKAAALVGIDAKAAKVVTVFDVDSRPDEDFAAQVQQHACNSNIEEVISGKPTWKTLLLHGEYVPAERFDLRNLNDVELESLGTANGRSLDLQQMQQIQRLQQSKSWPSVTDALLEALDARWSDHCAHTTWKSLGNLLKRLRTAAEDTRNDNIISMFHDNAGVWKFYGDWSLTLKAETHNGPTAVSAYFGQLTKVGGVLRDILGTGQGADPVGTFEYTGTGIPGTEAPLSNRPSPKQIAQETIRAVKEYGNTFGVPMLQSRMAFHPKYVAKPFALGGSIGLIPTNRAAKGAPQPGDMAMLIGGLTGNDGIHGASASSAGAVMDSTSVQIGAPLEAIKFREAILALRDADCVRALTDLGAAGINSAFGELGEATGVWINTARVQLKTSGLPMWRILVSESQERMALCVAPEKLQQTRQILDQFEVGHALIGRFTNNHRYSVVHDPALDEAAIEAMDVDALPQAAETGFDVSYDDLDYVPPSVEIGDLSAPKPPRHDWPVTRPDRDHIRAVFADNDVHDQSYASQQYDSSVQGTAHYGPVSRKTHIATGYTAIRPVRELPGLAVLSTAFSPWLSEIDPLRALRQALFSVLLKQRLAGVALKDICLSDNFYTPHLTATWKAELVAMVDELCGLSEAFGTPFISGKDSSAGSVETPGGVVSVPHGVFLTALGKVPDASYLRSESLQREGNLLVRIGLDTPALAGTSFSRVSAGQGAGEGDAARDFGGIDDVHTDEFFALLQALDNVPIRSARVIGGGGALATAAFMGWSSGDLGVECDDDSAQALFAEHRVSALAEIEPDQLGTLPRELMAKPVGRVVAKEGVWSAGRHLVGAEERRIFSGTFEETIR